MSIHTLCKCLVQSKFIMVKIYFGGSEGKGNKVKVFNVHVEQILQHCRLKELQG